MRQPVPWQVEVMPCPTCPEGSRRVEKAYCDDCLEKHIVCRMQAEIDDLRAELSKLVGDKRRYGSVDSASLAQSVEPPLKHGKER